MWVLGVFITSSTRTERVTISVKSLSLMDIYHWSATQLALILVVLGHMCERDILPICVILLSKLFDQKIYNFTLISNERSQFVYAISLILSYLSRVCI